MNYRPKVEHDLEDPWRVCWRGQNRSIKAWLVTDDDDDGGGGGGGE